jgi:hypothetical protein
MIEQAHPAATRGHVRRRESGRNATAALRMRTADAAVPKMKHIWEPSRPAAATASATMSWTCTPSRSVERLSAALRRSGLEIHGGVDRHARDRLARRVAEKQIRTSGRSHRQRCAASLFWRLRSFSFSASYQQPSSRLGPGRLEPCEPGRGTDRGGAALNRVHDQVVRSSAQGRATAVIRRSIRRSE